MNSLACDNTCLIRLIEESFHFLTNELDIKEVSYTFDFVNIELMIKRLGHCVIPLTFFSFTNTFDLAIFVQRVIITRIICKKPQCTNYGSTKKPLYITGTF